MRDKGGRTDTSGQLNPGQLRSLREIGEVYPAAFVEANAWTYGSSLIRKGFAAKVSTVAPLTEPNPHDKRARAAYRLTDKGLAYLAIEKREPV